MKPILLLIIIVSFFNCRKQTEVTHHQNEAKPYLNQNITDLEMFAYRYNPTAIDISKNADLAKYDLNYILNTAYKNKTEIKNEIVSVILLKQYLYHLQKYRQGYDLLSMRRGQAKFLIDYFLKYNNIKEIEFVNSGMPYLLLKERQPDNKSIENIILRIKEQEEFIIKQ